MKTLSVSCAASFKVDRTLQIMMACGNSRYMIGENEKVASSKKLRVSNLAYTMRTHFVFLKRKLEERIRDGVYEKYLTRDERLKLRIIDSDLKKADFLLKSILRRSEECCEDFMKYLLDENHIQKTDLQEVRVFYNDPTCQQFCVSDFAKDEFSNFLKDELEVIEIVDYLFEWHLIELEDHDNFLETNGRRSNVQRILDIMQQRDESWLQKFCYILKQHAQPRIIKYLKSLKNAQQMSFEDDDIPEFSSTIKVHANTETEQAIIQQNIAHINTCISDNGITVVGTRNGCVEFILLSQPKNDCLQLSVKAQEEMCCRFLQNLISMQAVNHTVRLGHKFKMTVQYYDKSLPLISKRGSTMKPMLDNRLAVQLSKHFLLESIDVLLFIKLLSSGGFVDKDLSNELCETKDEKLKKEYLIYFLSSSEESLLIEMLDFTKQYEQMGTFVEEIEKWRCLECYRKTVLEAYNDIEDDIDTDIMRQTLQNQTEVPAVIMNVCIDQADRLSRVKRASIFLQYILANEDLLLSFALVFLKRSQLVLQHSRCESCSLEPKQATYGTPHADEFNFIIKKNEMGELLVCSNGISDIRSAMPNVHMASEDELLRMLIFGKATKRKQLILNMLSNQILQRQQTQIDKMPLVKRLHLGHLNIICTEMPDITVKSPTLENFIAKLAATISPGPHITMVILGIFDENPMHALRELTDFFGEGILKHILLVFISESRLDSEEMLSEHEFLRQNYESALKMCNNEYIVVSTRSENSYVENQFASTIEQIVKRNGMEYFTNANIRNIESAIMSYMDEKTNYQYNEGLKEQTKMLQEIEKEESSHEKILDLRKKSIDDLLYIDSLQNFDSRTREAAKNMLSEFEMRTRKSLELT